MEKFSIKEHFKIHVDEIWNDEDFRHIEFLDRGYAVQDEIIQQSILFIGINPSFSGKNSKHESFFYNNIQDGEIHPYFRKFQDISRNIKMPWSHLDLLYIRETNQKNIERMNLSQNGNEFIRKQLLLSKRIIEKSNPRIIVVSNSFARRLLQLDFQIEFDENLRTYRIINNAHLESTPVFFTSMLTGRRALDLGSYERLIWHLKFALCKRS